MEVLKKAICLIRGGKDISYTEFENRINDVIELIRKNINPVKLSFTITAEPPPKISIIPFRKNKISVVAIYYFKATKADFLKDIKGFSGYYEVTEVFPVCYEKTWKNHEVTPGICLLTLFRKKKNIDYETFIDRWHNGHTPLSLKLHPLWHYNRNVVENPVIEGPNWYDGIVEEHCRNRNELLNPFRFFGKGLKLIPNMIKVYRDVNSFIDYGSIESYLVKEIHIV